MAGQQPQSFSMEVAPPARPLAGQQSGIPMIAIKLICAGVFVLLGVLLLVFVVLPALLFSRGGDDSTTTTTTITIISAVPGEPPYVDYAKDGFKGFSWGPLWLKDQSCLATWTPPCAGFDSNDMSSEWAQPIWSSSYNGRGDLNNIKTMGANTVRLYGNDPRMNHRPFLDYARSLKLQIVMGLSGWLYNEGGGPECARVGRKKDCEAAVSEYWLQNLDRSLLEDGYYHNSLTVINLANEPDFYGIADDKPDALGPGPLYLRAMVEAFDGLLSAEKQKSVKPWFNGKLPQITATWSFANGLSDGKTICTEKYGVLAGECGPGYAFMIQFARAVQDPQKYVGYSPKNNILAAYHSRWINSVQLFVHSNEMKFLLLDYYSSSSLLNNKSLIATEWHGKPDQPEKEDVLKDLRNFESWRKGDMPFLLGVSWFQYQVAYEKDGEERNFGLFRLGSKLLPNNLRSWSADGRHYEEQPVNCLTPSRAEYVEQITKAWGGSKPIHGLCDDIITT